MTIRAEQIKLATTRSPVWTMAGVVVLSLGLAALQASVGSMAVPIEPERAAIGVATFAVPILLVLAALTVTGEYRTGMIRTTFLTTPNRVRVLLAKATVAAVFAGVWTAVMVAASAVVVRLIGTERQGADLALSDPPVWRTVGAITVYAMLGSVLAVGLGALIRHSAGVIAVLLMMPFVVEPLLGAMPQVGERVGPLLPFTNANAFTAVPSLRTVSMWWGPLGSLAYFAGFVVVVFVLAMIDINRRDP
jgi:ABC-2 type transport system permease protein